MNYGWPFFAVCDFRVFKDTAELTEGRSLKLTLPINILTPVNCWFEDQPPNSPSQSTLLSVSHTLPAFHPILKQ